MKKPNYVFKYCKFCCKKLRIRRFKNKYSSGFYSFCANKKCIGFGYTQASRHYDKMFPHYYLIFTKKKSIEARYYYKESIFWFSDKSIVKEELSVEDFFKTYESINRNIIFE